MFIELILLYFEKHLNSQGTGLTIPKVSFILIAFCNETKVESIKANYYKLRNLN